MAFTVLSFAFGSKLTSAKMTQLYDNTAHNEDWIGGSYTKATDHNHNGSNSAYLTSGTVEENNLMAFIGGAGASAMTGSSAINWTSPTSVYSFEITVHRTITNPVFEMQITSGNVTITVYCKINVNGVDSATNSTTSLTPVTFADVAVATTLTPGIYTVTVYGWQSFAGAPNGTVIGGAYVRDIGGMLKYSKYYP